VPAGLGQGLGVAERPGRVEGFGAVDDDAPADLGIDAGVVGDHAEVGANDPVDAGGKPFQAGVGAAGVDMWTPQAGS
jgi:hypothetical protein